MMSSGRSDSARLCACAAAAVDRGYLVLDPECDPAQGGGPCKELTRSNDDDPLRKRATEGESSPVAMQGHPTVDLGQILALMAKSTLI